MLSDFFSGIIHISWVYTFTVTYIRSISINFRDRGVSIINVGLLSLARCRTLHVGWNFHVCPNYFARSNSLTSFSIVTLYIVELWECVCHRLSIIRTHFGGVEGVEGVHVKLLYSNPKRRYPSCIAYASVGVWHFKIGSTAWARSVKRFCVEKNKERKTESAGNFKRVDNRM